MKKFLSLLTVLLLVIAGYSQAPGIFNYQGVARNSVGNVLENKTISIRLSIRDISVNGIIVYSETRSVQTNPFGLFNIQVGSPGATGVIGTILGVNWAKGNKYIQVEIDPTGGSSFINIGIAQIASVPYALYSESGLPIGPAGGDLTGTYPNPTVAKIRGVNVSTLAPTTNYVLGFDGTNWTPTSLATHVDNYWRLNGTHIYNANSGNVGIGVTNPTAKLSVNEVFKVTDIGTVQYANSVGQMIMMFESGTSNPDRMVIGHSSAFPNWGLQYQDASDKFHFVNNGTPVLTTDLNQQRVGIGNGSPTYKLDVTGQLRVVDGNEGLNRIFSAAVGDATGLGTWRTAASLGIVSGTGTLNYVPKWTPDGVTLGNSQIFDNATNVGVGTITPAHKFEVQGLMRINATSNQEGGELRFQEGNLFGPQNHWIIDNFQSVAGGNKFRIWNDAGGTAFQMMPSSRVAIGNMAFSDQPQSTLDIEGNLAVGAGYSGAIAAPVNGAIIEGNVGIGNSSPSYKLDVTGQLRVVDGNQGLNRLFAAAVGDASGLGTWRTPASLGIVSGSGTLNYVPKWTPDGVTLGNSQIFDNATNVGVGTITPAHKLEVQGLMRINATSNQEGGELRFQEGNLFGPQNHWIIDNFQSVAGGNKFRIWNDGGGTAFQMMPSSRVAIGNMALSDQPQSTLDIEGNLAVGAAYSGTTAAPLNGAIIQGSVGIGNSSPTYKLDVTGQLRVVDGNQGLNRLFAAAVGDATGLGTWRTPSSLGIVSGTGTLNFVTKWTPDGVTLGNSQLFDDGINVGLGTLIPSARLHVISIPATGGPTAILGESNNQDNGGYAIHGLINPTNPGSFSAAIRGENNGTGSFGIGVYGSQNGNGWGVYGVTPGGIGVYGQSSSGWGLRAVSNTNTATFSTSNTGVGGDFRSNTSMGVRALSSGWYGVWGETSTDQGNNNAGTLGFATHNASVGFSKGIWGYNATDNSDGAGGLFQHEGSGYGVIAFSGNNGTGVYGEAGSAGVGVRAVSNTGFGVWSSSNTGTAVYGTTNGTTGGLNAIHGIINSTSPGGGSAAIRGENNGTGGSGIGVYGTQDGTGWGVYGFTPGGIGVYGQSSTGWGVRAQSNTNTGVFSTSTSGLGGDFRSVSNIGLRVHSQTNHAGFFTVNDLTNNSVSVVALNDSRQQFGRAIYAEGSGYSGYYWTSRKVVEVQSDSTVGVAVISSFNTGVLSGSQTGTPVLGYVFTQNGTGNAAVYGYSENAESHGLLGVSPVGGIGRALRTAGSVQMSGINEANNYILGSDAVGNATWKPLSAVGGVLGSGNLNRIPKWTPNGFTIGNSQMIDNGTSVGLGTLTPSGATKLDIVGSFSQMRLLDNTFNSEVWLSAPDAGYTGGIGTTTVHDFPIFAGGVDRVMVKSDGRVGIGTNFPSAMTEVFVNSFVGFPHMLLNENDNDYGRLTLKNTNAANSGNNFWDIAGYTNDTRAFERLNIYNNATGDLVSVTGDGRVGVGTFNPSVRFHVNSGIDINTGMLEARRADNAGPHQIFNSGGQIAVIDYIRTDYTNGAEAYRRGALEVRGFNRLNLLPTNSVDLLNGMTILSNGNVGVGMTSPVWNFEVSSTVTVVNITDTDNGSQVGLVAPGTGYTGGVGTSTTHDFPIFTNNVDRVMVKADGKVGVNTLAPTGRLHVVDVGEGIRSEVTYPAFAYKAGANVFNSRNSNFTFLARHNTSVNPNTPELVTAISGVDSSNGTYSAGIAGYANGGTNLMASGVYGFSGFNHDLVNYPVWSQTYSGGQFWGADYGVTGSVWNAAGQTGVSTTKIGVLGWVSFPNPLGTNYGVYSNGATGGGTNYAGYFVGNVHVQGNLSASGAKPFKIDHPLDPANKYLTHFAMESPEVQNVYNGNARTDANGKATVKLPDYFEAVNKDFKYQLTVVDETQFAMARISKKIAGNSFEIMSSIPNIEISWQITAVRNDKAIQKYAIPAESDKLAHEKGKYLDPELYGKTEADGLNRVSKTGKPEVAVSDMKSVSVDVKNLPATIMPKQIPQNNKQTEDQIKEHTNAQQEIMKTFAEPIEKQVSNNTKQTVEVKRLPVVMTEAMLQNEPDVKETITNPQQEAAKTQKVQLTPDQQKQIDALQRQIDQMKNQVKTGNTSVKLEAAENIKLISIEQNNPEKAKTNEASKDNDAAKQEQLKKAKEQKPNLPEDAKTKSQDPVQTPDKKAEQPKKQPGQQ